MGGAGPQSGVVWGLFFHFMMNSGSAASIEGSDWDNPTTHHTNWLPTGVWQGLISGFYYDDLNFQDNFGYYWSSTAYVTANAYGLYFNDELVFPDYDSGKSSGYAVRCAI